VLFALKGKSIRYSYDLNAIVRQLRKGYSILGTVPSIMVTAIQIVILLFGMITTTTFVVIVKYVKGILQLDLAY
jgi:hypothetical protein